MSSVLTAKGKYGLKALCHLARLEPGSVAQVGEIAQQNDIPRKFLDTILLDLKNAGILRSKKGPKGGYALARSPQETSLGAAIRVLDGPLAPIGCASRTLYRPCDDCRDVERCVVRLTMLKVRDAVADILDHTTVADALGDPPALPEPLLDEALA